MNVTRLAASDSGSAREPVVFSRHLASAEPAPSAAPLRGPMATLHTAAQRGCALAREAPVAASGAGEQLAATIGMPLQCANASRSFDGFARQRCLGSQLSKALEFGRSADDGANRRTIGAAICTADRLVRHRLLDDCHLVAHALGQTLWQRYAARHAVSTAEQLSHAAATLVPLCPPRLCLDGCIHAVLVELLAAAKRSGLDLTAARPLGEAACGEQTRAAALAGDVGIGRRLADDHVFQWDYSCHHGIGHGIGALVASGLLDLPSALPLCGAIVPDIHTSIQPAQICESGMLMEVVDARVEMAAAHAWASGSLLDSYTVNHVCKDITETTTQLMESQHMESVRAHRLQSSCFENLGEGLMFASCHDETLSLAACANLAAETRSTDVQRQYRRTCEDAARSEANTLLTEARMTQTSGACADSPATIAATLQSPCMEAAQPLDPNSPLGAWCCAADGLFPHASRGWSCASSRAPAPFGGAPHDATPPIATLSLGLMAAVSSPPSPAPPPPPAAPLAEMLPPTLAVVSGVIVLLIVGLLAWWRRRQQRQPPHLSIGRSLERVQSARWQNQLLASARHERSANAVLKARPGSVVQLRAMRRVQITGRELELERVESESLNGSMPNSPYLSPMPNSPYLAPVSNAGAASSHDRL